MTKKLNIIVGNDNVFLDLGFPEAEAQNLLLRADLVIHIRKVIDKLGVTQAEAAKRAGITQPRMNDLVKGRTQKFTLDALVNVAAQLGYTVKLSLKKVAYRHGYLCADRVDSVMGNPVFNLAVGLKIGRAHV